MESGTLQRTEQWHKDRIGKATASKVYDIIKGRSGYKAARKEYMVRTVIEMMTGEPQDTYFNADMERGIELEPLGRSEYEVRTGVEIDQAGFGTYLQFDRLGASPDGLIEPDGGIEIKCPRTHNHIMTIDTGKIAPNYLYQMQTNMLVFNRSWWDFVSFDPSIPREDLQLFVIRVEADKKMQTEIIAEAMKFISEVDKLFERFSS